MGGSGLRPAQYAVRKGKTSLGGAILEAGPEVFQAVRVHLEPCRLGAPSTAPRDDSPTLGPTDSHPALLTTPLFAHTWFLPVGPAFEGTLQSPLSSQGCPLPSWLPWPP